MNRLALRLLAASCAVLMFGGCVLYPFRHEAPRPGRTTLDAPLVVVPAQVVGNYLVVRTKWDKHGPYHFLVDTGSTSTLVSPELAARYRSKKAPPLLNTPQVRVTSAVGKTALLPATVLRRLELGGALFEDVPALLYDCSALSAHLGIKIDGILGFPLFRETLCTLDYPNATLLLQRATLTPPLLPGVTIPFNNANKTPLIPVRLGDRTFVALIDSGNDAPLSLNPVGLAPDYAVPLRPGATVGTLTGDHIQQIGRLAATLRLGDYTLPRPLVDLTDELSAIGGGILKNFAVTFDQERDQVTLFRESREPVPSPPRRSAGLSFTKTPVYWRVAGVIPASPAASASVQPGDLIIRINDQPVAQWDLARYEQLVATSDRIAFTFLNGKRATELKLAVFELVP